MCAILINLTSHLLGLWDPLNYSTPHLRRRSLWVRSTVPAFFIYLILTVRRDCSQVVARGIFILGKFSPISNTF